MEKNIKKNRYVYNWVNFLDSRDQHNVINQKNFKTWSNSFKIGFVPSIDRGIKTIIWCIYSRVTCVILETKIFPRLKQHSMAEEYGHFFFPTSVPTGAQGGKPSSHSKWTVHLSKKRDACHSDFAQDCLPALFHLRLPPWSPCCKDKSGEENHLGSTDTGKTLLFPKGHVSSGASPSGFSWARTGRKAGQMQSDGRSWQTGLRRVSTCESLRWKCLETNRDALWHVFRCHDWQRAHTKSGKTVGSAIFLGLCNISEGSAMC